jgi:thioredoxin reductase (NADPH)
MIPPILMVVDDEAEALQVIERELEKRYGADYEVICEPSAEAALQSLEELKAREGEAALLLSDLWMPEMSGVEFLARAHAICPQAKRLLMIRWGDRSASQPLLRAMALGQLDAFSAKPRGSPDEQFHKVIAEALENWARRHQPTVVVQVVGERWSARAHELRDLFERNGVLYGFYDLDSEEGQRLVAEVERPSGPFPLLVLMDGRTLADPSNTEIAEAFGVSTQPEEGLYDLVIVGAGPAGLSAAVYGASEGLSTLVIEREATGGQAGTSSLIRNYLGFPLGISGGELATRAWTQAQLFGAKFILTQEVRALRDDGDKRVVVLASGAEAMSRAVVLAMGVSYRRLNVPRLEALVGAGVFYGAAVTEAQAMQGEEVYVAEAGNSAGQAAIYLAKYAAKVTMLVRGGSLAASMSDYLVKEIAACENLHVRLNTEIIDGHGEHRLEGLVLRDKTSGTTEAVPAAALFILIGAQPHTAWLPPTISCDERGFTLTGYDLMREGRLPEGWPLERPPQLFETSMPGVFAVGDVRHRSVKRVASAVGEGSIAIQLVHEYLAE